MFTVISGALYDGLPLIPLAVAFVWTLRYQRVADLSLAGSFSVSAACTAYLLNASYDPIVSVAAGLFVGMAVGAAMGLSVKALHVEPLLAGLIVLFITYALSLGVTQGTIPIPRNNNPLNFLRNLETQRIGSIGLHVWVIGFFLFIGLLSVWTTSKLLNSEWGCAFRALEDMKGGQPMLRSLGISPAKVSIIGFVIAGLLSSVSGILVTLRDHQTTSSLGLDSLIDVIPAYLLGITLFEKHPELHRHGESRIIHHLHRLRSLSSASAAATGVIILFLTVNSVQQFAPLPWLPKVLIGVTLLVLLGLRPGIEAWQLRKREHRATSLTASSSPLQIRGLSVIYPTWDGDKTVLREVSLEASQREIVQIKGPNGAGKSTLLKALTGKVQSTGTFTIPVIHPNARHAERAPVVAYIPQDTGECTVATLSVAEHTVLSVCGRTVSPFRSWKKKADSSFNRLDARDIVSDKNALVEWLSEGQRRRVVIGLIALRNPRPVVLALDEPFNDLDAEGRRRCARLLTDFASDGHIVLLVDHQDHITPTRTVGL